MIPSPRLAGHADILQHLSGTTQGHVSCCLVFPMPTGTLVLGFLAPSPVSLIGVHGAEPQLSLLSAKP